MTAASSSNRSKVASSTAWTLGERVLTLALAWGVGILVANHLGVSDYGQLLYVVALVSLLSSVVSAGLGGIVVRELVQHHDQRHQILGTVFVIRSTASVVSVAGIVLVVALTSDSSSETLMTAVIAIGLGLKVTEVFEFWFQARTEMRWIATASITGTAFGAVLRVVLIQLDSGVVPFAFAIAVEQVVSSLALFLIYQRRVGSLRQWSISWPLGLGYLRQSWPLTLAGLASTLNLRADQVMLGLMAGTSAVGVYAVAARLSEVWYFAPVALAAVIFPTVIRAREQGEQHYRRRLRQLYGAFIWSAILVAILLTVLARPLIEALYSPEFDDAAGVLIIHVWSAPFLFAGVVFSKWLIIERLYMTSLVRHGMGAALNVALNLVLIPAHGPTGSAVATLISYAVATYGASFLTAKTRPAAIDMTLGFLLPITLTFERSAALLRR